MTDRDGLTAKDLADRHEHEGIKTIFKSIEESKALSQESSSQGAHRSGSESYPRSKLVADIGEEDMKSKVSPERVTISCPEKGEVVGKVVFLPRSFKELLEIGAKEFNVYPAKVFLQNGGDVENIRSIRDNDHVVFVSADLESNIPERQNNVKCHGSSKSEPTLSHESSSQGTHGSLSESCPRPRSKSEAGIGDEDLKSRVCPKESDN